MKYRYSVYPESGGWAGWQVRDNCTGTIDNFYKTRKEAREACKRMNAEHVQGRDDQQQSREETI